jgi:hypothetical protein
MGSYAQLNFSNYEILSTKSFVDPTIMTIFREYDKKVFNRVIDDGHEETAYEYSNTVKNIRDRLDVMGFSMGQAKKQFEKYRKIKISEVKQSLESWDEEIYKIELAILKKYKFGDWQSAFEEIIKKRIRFHRAWEEEFKDKNELIQYIASERDYEPYYNFPSDDIRYFFRVFLQAFKDDDIVCYDVTQLVENGYYGETDEICNLSIGTLTEENIVNEKTIVLIEGKTDKRILEESLRLLYPHLKDYYSFLDYEISNNGGGADKVVYLIKSFVGVGLGNRVIAIFDNDTAAEDAMQSLKKVKIPRNIKITKYPDMAMFKKYPTLGPGGISNQNINGLAASIELYLGKDVLSNQERVLTPVQWKGYNQSLKKYQGEIMEKDDLHKRFFEKVKLASVDNKNIPLCDWEGIEAIFKVIFNSFA